MPTTDPDRIAKAVLDAHAAGRQIAPFSETDSGFDLDTAYAVAARVREARRSRGERPIGPQDRLHQPHDLGRIRRLRADLGGAVYDTTVRDIADLEGAFALGGMVEPRIEPEIVFGLERAPEPGMDDPGAPRLHLLGRARLSRSSSRCFRGWRFSRRRHGGRLRAPRRAADRAAPG